MKKSILSGMQPTNPLMLGNYIGALKNWVKLQNEYDCFFAAVDLHAITVKIDPKILHQETLRAVATYIAAGIDPEKSKVFIQSHVREHAELGWVLNCFTYMGELSRMTQFKDKSAKVGTSIPVGLFTYPVLMAADILLYDTALVPVGADQKQHLELTRDIAIRMNGLYGDDLFKVPEPYIPPVGAKIMSLQNPEIKMSKSDSDPNATIYIWDSDDAILKKFKKAVTDSGSEITYDDSKPGVKNLITIQAVLTGKSPDNLVADYADKQYGHLKIDTANTVIETLRPIRERAQALLDDRATLDSYLKQGAEKAREVAQRTLKRVYERVGFVPAAR